jgi:phenylacetic acid degradation operon negative regulatory protein
VRPTARSLILDLLATLREGAMPVRALVAAGGLFGIEENAVRVALARLLAAGLVGRDERGRYRAGARATAVGRQIAGWRRLDDAVRTWDGAWVAVIGRVAGPRAERALRFFAFRALEDGLRVRPDNLRGGVAAVRERLAALGLPGHAVVGTLHQLDAAREARARTLWDAAALRAGYRHTTAALVESERRLPQLPVERAMAESFLLGGRAIRQLVLDPLLPEALVPAAERAALLATMRRYDRTGRAAWRGFLRTHRVLPEERAPVDVRIIEGATA